MKMSDDNLNIQLCSGETNLTIPFVVGARHGSDMHVHVKH